VNNAIFDTSLTDAQWDYLLPMLPKFSKRGCPPTDRRRILDAILHVVKCGVPWRYLPADFSPWKTVYHGYTGESFAQCVKQLRPRLVVEVVKRSDDTRGFKVLPHRWVVERTFGWLMRHHRLVRDYENTESSPEAWIFVALIRIHLRRLD
jgi:transposase